MWQKYITRRLAVQVAQAWNFGWGKSMKKVYGVCLLNTLIFRDEKKTEYYVDSKQFKKYINGLNKLLNYKKFLKDFHKEVQRKLEEILRETRRRFRQDFSKLSNYELLKIYQNFILPNLEQFYIRMWTVFNIAAPLADKITREIRKYVKNKEKRREYLLSLSSPLKPNDVINERIDLLRLSLRKGNRDKAIKLHTEKYRHIPMFDFDHEPYSEKYFLKELKSIRNPRKELKEFGRLFKERKKEFQKIVAILKPDKKFKNLLVFLKENVFLRDFRDMLRQKYNLELRKFYLEVGKRLGLDIKQVATLTNEEIIKYLKTDKKFPKNEVKKREKAYLLIQRGDRVEIYSGLKAILKAKDELKIDRLKRVKIIKGVIGSRGLAKGRVKIVYTNRDLNKVKRRDILIAAMTRQDFFPAIRKASAIVTDEGGITCHAAIVSRELKIPCLVGTKIATKVLEDEDRVEVDATKGIVRKI